MSNNVTKGLIKQCYLCSCTSSELKSDVNVSTCSVRYFRMTVWLEMRSRFSRKHSSTLPPQNMATEIRYFSLPIPTPVDRIADTCENITFQHFTGQLNPCHLLLLPLPTSGEGYVFTHVSPGPGFPHLSTNPPIILC